MRSSIVFGLIAALAPQVLATIFVTSPVATTTWTGGSTAVISWEDDGNAPLLATIGACSVGIYAGNSQQQTLLQEIVDSVNVATTASIQFTVDPTIGPDSSAYFVRFTSTTYKDPATPQYAYEQFSARYAMTNMSGQFNSTVQAQINSSGAATTSSGSSAAASTTSHSSSSTAATVGATSTAKSASAAATPSTTAKSGASALEAGVARVISAGLAVGLLSWVL